jgi:hypothetical protein
MATAHDDNKDDGVSSLLVNSVGVMSVAMLGGIFAASKYEKFKFDRRLHSSPAVMAVRALVAGTVLCVGAFGLAGTLFVKGTGIDSMQKMRGAGESVTKAFGLGATPEQQAYYNAEEAALQRYVHELLAGDAEQTQNKRRKVPGAPQASPEQKSGVVATWLLDSMGFNVTNSTTNYDNIAVYDAADEEYEEDFEDVEVEVYRDEFDDEFGVEKD